MSERLGVTMMAYATASMLLWFVHLNWVIFAWFDLGGSILGWFFRIALFAWGLHIYRNADW
jgi:hypothetical protein